MNDITIYEYLACNVPSECQNLLSRYDVPPVSTVEELTENLKAYVRVQGEDGLKDLADIHPDKELIELLSYTTPYEGKPKDEKEYLNAAGTLGRIEGLENQLRNGNNEQPQGFLSKMDLLFGIGVALLTMTFFKKD
jgi:hypothetical protein